jgi:hypothetical protein
MLALRAMQSPWQRGVGRALAFFALVAAVAVAAPAHADETGWPRQFDTPSGTFVVYQLQPEDLSGDVLTGRAAFSLLKPGAANPTFGVFWFTEHVEIDRDSSMAMARSLDVTKVRLPDITPDEASRYEQLIEAQAASWDLSGSLEELQAGLTAAERERASAAGLGNAPPRILFASERAILIVYDGAPILEPIEGSKLQRVSNTPYALVLDPSTHNFYLNGANLWYWAKDPMGPWSALTDVPAAVRAIVPPDTAVADQVQGAPPRVYTATEPTELIATDGPPRYAPLVADELLYVSNTESDVLREVSSQAMYVLLAGRWYRALSQDGPWSFVRADQLPASFKRIPPESPKGNLLASVAGTDQAEDAVADAEIPQTSAIRRSSSGFMVIYDGPPQFEPIPGTSMQYAVNTDAEVILADGRYYACDQGVWYVADHPEGPWSVSDTRPLGVDDIQPDSPLYNVRYVYVFDATREWVYMGYLPGYVGCYPYYGTVVYGAGYSYRPWRGRHHYYPRPTTWGFHPRYNPWLSRWGFGLSYGSGFLRVGMRWHSGPAGQHHGPPMWFGPGGYRRPWLDSDMTLLRTRRQDRTRVRPGDRAPSNLYNRPENVARVDREAMKIPQRLVTRVAPKQASVPNNVFAGKDGKVYQRDGMGNWKVNSGHTWTPTKVPAVPPTTTWQPPRGGTSGGSAPGNWKPGGVTPGGGTGRVAPPAQRTWPKPAPSERPVGRQTQAPNMPPPQRPEPPRISPTPGNLEREFHARERAGQTPPVAMPPTPRPGNPTHPPKQRIPPGEKH